ncbi:Ig-like domain-containing protein [Geomobilimonas luticola]|uniref:RapA2 cadherin-like domain-containing protein n=1 Tax=Geomobilimonas luticola TaxID=1114878 RepID=A0ABS5SBL7_9BACT|nr:Ig-like domain-containing protein [Geomobilimonas luticola]MBT0652768.1 hypothetical protein [Geomobilimonas luticola]
MQELKQTVPVAIMLLLLASGPVRGELAAVSGKPAPLAPNALTEVFAGGNPANVAVNLAHGFPVWYRDTNGVKLELCLDKPVIAANGIVTPCITAEPFPSNPFSFPGNFGAEAFWWNATAVGTYSSLSNGTPAVGGDILVVAALEAAFGNPLGIPEEDQQVAFGRIRVRINVPVAGTYRLTHPYGTRDYVVAPGDLGTGREIIQTQDIGIATPLDFTQALANGPLPLSPPAPTPPNVSVGIVDQTGRSIGPFLTPVLSPFDPVIRAGGPLSVNGSTYLAEPGTDAVPIIQGVTAAPAAAPFGNAVTLELLNPPAGFILNAANGTQTVTIDRFQVMGKLFNDGPNVRPSAVADKAATPRNKSVSIDVVRNDTDPVGTGNVHGINPQALGVLAANGAIVRSAPLVTSKGGLVVRTTNLATGKTTFTYTPATGFTGEDSFSYVVQDTGGLISEPAVVTVMVEDLVASRAEFRPRTGRWHLTGTSTDVDANSVTIHGGPRASLAGATGAQAGIGLRASDTAMEFRLNVDTMPASAITTIDLRLTTPDGPALFTLYDSAFDGPFTTLYAGTLTPANLQPRPVEGVSSFADAVAKVLDGSVYVSIRTAAAPGGAGELSGRIIRPLIGTAAVRNNGTWSFRGPARVSPGPFASVSITSANGITLKAVPVGMR